MDIVQMDNNLGSHYISRVYSSGVVILPSLVQYILMQKNLKTYLATDSAMKILAPNVVEWWIDDSGESISYRDAGDSTVVRIPVESVASRISESATLNEPNSKFVIENTSPSSPIPQGEKLSYIDYLTTTQEGLAVTNYAVARSIYGADTVSTHLNLEQRTISWSVNLSRYGSYTFEEVATLALRLALFGNIPSKEAILNSKPYTEPARDKNLQIRFRKEGVTGYGGLNIVVKNPTGAWEIWANGLSVAAFNGLLSSTVVKEDLGGGSTRYKLSKGFTGSDYTFLGGAESITLEKSEGSVDFDLEVITYSSKVKNLKIQGGISEVKLPKGIPTVLTNLDDMFKGCKNFNQDISDWDVSRVVSMNSMFEGCDKFNQDLSSWCVTNIAQKPTNFDLGATVWTLPKPVWGTCPN